MVSLKSFKLINDNEIDDLDDDTHRHDDDDDDHHLHPHRHHHHQYQHQRVAVELAQASNELTATSNGQGADGVGQSDRIRILQQQQQRDSVTFNNNKLAISIDDNSKPTSETIGTRAAPTFGLTSKQSRDKTRIIRQEYNNSFNSQQRAGVGGGQSVEPNNNNSEINNSKAISPLAAANDKDDDDENKSMSKERRLSAAAGERARDQDNSRTFKMGAAPGQTERDASDEQQVAALPVSHAAAAQVATAAAATTLSSETTNIDRQQQQQPRANGSLMTKSTATPTESSSISIVVVRHNDNKQAEVAVAATTANCDIDYSTTSSRNSTSSTRGDQADEEELSSEGGGSGGGQDQTSSSSHQSGSDSLPSVMMNHNDLAAGNGTQQVATPTTGRVYKSYNLLSGLSRRSSSMQQAPPGASDTEESRLSVTTESEHFEIVWSNLSYRIEPKWYKKFNYVERVLSHFAPGQTVDAHSSATSTASSSANMHDDQHQMHHAPGSGKLSASRVGVAEKSPSSSLEPIEIFTNLNGTIRSGQMTAVLGPSGAGKTTLLNCLTGKLRNGVSGHINLKGANGKHLKMCTIPQKDHLLEQLTVEENLWFASKIKNPEYGFDHAKNIERVIDLLGLKRCRSAKIKKISGGQHKRVSIAQELLSNPDILVLDEPTSGLDSLTCFKTISMLRDLVELSANNDFMKPMAIIVTIHQPQPKVFNLFHHVYILANGGRVIYEGSPADSLETITNVTCLQPIDSSKSTSLTPGAVDPASFLIEIASEEYGLDVINTLSDYQRNTFYEANNARETKRHNEHMRKQQQHHSGRSKKSFCKSFTGVNNSKSGQENYGFASEYDTENNTSSTFVTKRATDFIVPANCNLEAPANHHLAPPSKLEISCAGSDNASSDYAQSNGSGDNRKCKRRKRSVYSLEGTPPAASGKQQQSSHHKINFNSSDQNLYLSEQLLYTRVPNHKGRFWSHTATLTHRTLLTIRRDPLLMTSRVLFHLMIPILMGHVYGKSTGAANACPHYEPEIDITQIPSLVENKRIEFMLEELHMSIENVSMFFIIMYAFAAAVLALNALSFPLNMQVLLKETRNGWYSMSSYVLAKTLADLPLELTMPCMTMLLVYPLTGQPSSYLQWRMLTICLIMTLCSLIAQTQALILGALVMNSVQTAVFVSQASQLPWVILAGFTIRIKRLSEPLKLISLTSFYRLGCEAITLTRYGFGICPCNPQEITGQPVRLVGIPDQLRTVAQYWLDSIESSKANNDTIDGADGGDGDITTTVSSLVTTTTTTMMPSTANGAVAAAPKTDIFQHLANQLSYANSYGVNITSCDDVAPDRIRAINLGDNWLVARIWHLFIMLIIMKIILYYAVRFSIGIRL